MAITKTLFLSGLLVASIASSEATTYTASALQPPPVPREFRGLWIATVGNIDWPGKSTRDTAAQKAELISILDRAAALNLNAIILQVRPACDALYPSSLEPWSEYLTGTMGKSPEPFYDPLAFAISEAHKRGMELHAWFNPYRALHKSHEGRVAPNHISRTRPDLVRKVGQYLWLDPGERDVQEYSLSVIKDVVRRYDIDAVHFDDYFYPDPAESGGADFPDDASWQKFGAGGRLSREDWRRQNVNVFLQRVQSSVKSAKPWVKFGVSPHGIWRPGHPAQIKGYDAYGKIYADSREWLVKGWVDYFSPQLYWRIDPKEQSFPVLLNWWAQQNLRQRHLWPGLAAYRAAQWDASEIANQIQLIRTNSGSTGYALYNANSVLRNTTLSGQLERNINRSPALVPASPWMGGSTPAKPAASVSGQGQTLTLHWKAVGTNTVRWWVVQTRSFSDWKTQVLPANTTSLSLDLAPDAIAVTAVDRMGHASAPAVLEPRRTTPGRQRILHRK